MFHGSRLAKVNQWCFPDTAQFKDNITTCDESAMNIAMETYSQLVLTLMLPHRCKEDLMADPTVNFPFTKKLQQIYKEETSGYRPVKVFTEDHLQFLQNLQNTRKNSLRVRIQPDELGDSTVPFDGTGLPQDDDDFDEHPDDDDDDFDVNADYESFLDAMCEDNIDVTDHDPAFITNKLQGFSFHNIRKKGVLDSGMQTDVPVPPLQVTNDFVQYLNGTAATDDTAKLCTPEKRVPTYIDDFARLLLLRNTARTTKFLGEDKQIETVNANGTASSIRSWSKAVCGTDKKQQRAFEVIISSFLLTFYHDATLADNEAPAALTVAKRTFLKEKCRLRRLMALSGTDQLVCLLHGPGGSGKSTVIDAVKAYAKEFCDLMDHPFTARTIVVTAMSGVAATLIKGETTHSVVGLNRKKITQHEIDDFADARLIIVDEISFASPGDIRKIYKHLTVLMGEQFQPYGGINIVLAGDFSQMEPVRADTLYSERVPEFHDSLNCFIELDGTWRFLKDPQWGQTLLRFRNGQATVQDIRHINETCNINTKPPPPKIQIATYQNKDRDAVNCSMFERYCDNNQPAVPGDLFKPAVLIFMDDLEMQNSKEVYVPIKSNSVKKYFYENCGESCLKLQRGRCDSVLKLYPDCPLMYSLNSDVSNGEANGSRVSLQHINVKPGERCFIVRLKCGVYVRAYFASQVHSLLVKHEKQDIVPPTFKVMMKNNTFTSKIRIGTENHITRMKGNQFPIISNTCTTGHKLQGCTVDDILVNHFHYSSNWAYVVLSRVRTMAGLYLRDELSEDLRNYEVSQDMLDMLQEFRQTIGVVQFCEEEYDQLLADIADLP